jgi:hypothetical protein
MCLQQFVLHNKFTLTREPPNSLKGLYLCGQLAPSLREKSELTGDFWVVRILRAPLTIGGVCAELCGSSFRRHVPFLSKDRWLLERQQRRGTSKAQR